MKNVADILCDLINIRTDDVSKSNKEFVDYVCRLFDEEGVVYERVLAHDGLKENIVAVVGAPSLQNIKGVVLSGHMDTVPANINDWKTDPFKAAISDGKIFGRGAVDMKFFIACVLSILPDIKHTRVPIIISFSCDEETHVLGIQDICNFFKERNIYPQYALVGEPTDFNVRVGHKGYFGYTTTIKGKSAHSSRPERGINAIFIAARLISKIEELSQSFSDQSTTLNVGAIRGGEQRTTIIFFLFFVCEIRSTHDQSVQWVLTQLQNFYDTVKHLYPGAEINVETKEVLPVFEEREKGLFHEIISHILKTQDVTSFSATEAGFFQKEGIETLICGVSGSATAHTAEEHVYIADLEKYNDFLKKLIAKLNEVKLS